MAIITNITALTAQSYWRNTRAARIARTRKERDTAISTLKLIANYSANRHLRRVAGQGVELFTNSPCQRGAR